jgi:hypothetical protein
MSRWSLPLCKVANYSFQGNCDRKLGPRAPFLSFEEVGVQGPFYLRWQDNDKTNAGRNSQMIVTTYNLRPILW